jgi:hypothetical protein
MTDGAGAKANRRRRHTVAGITGAGERSWAFPSDYVSTLGSERVKLGIRK